MKSLDVTGIPSGGVGKASIEHSIASLAKLNLPSRTVEPPNVWEEAVKEVRTGPFSILSEKAQDRILNLVRLAMEDAYRRGCMEGQKK